MEAIWKYPDLLVSEWQVTLDKKKKRVTDYALSTMQVEHFAFFN